MVMHSNERGECCPCTLVDRKRKRYDNAVDVVVRLHDPTDPSTERTAPPSSAHVQPDDVRRTPIQPSVEGEFRQHDGVVTMLMFYRRRASPKHRYSIIEVDYGGGGHRTRLKDQTINCCVSRVPPAPVYKGARGRGAAGQEGRARRSPTPTGSRTPSLFHVGLGEEGGRGGGEEGRGGAAPLSLSYSD